MLTRTKRRVLRDIYIDAEPVSLTLHRGGDFVFGEDAHVPLASLAAESDTLNTALPRPRRAEMKPTILRQPYLSGLALGSRRSYDPK